MSQEEAEKIVIETEALIAKNANELEAVSKQLLQVQEDIRMTQNALRSSQAQLLELRKNG
jgi:hypothetical protein